MEQLPETLTRQFSTLMSEIDKGQIKIPQFQRDFVWKKEASAKLLDSIVKGYPVGTFIFWRTKEQLRSIKNIGGITLPDTGEDNFIDYILDGQQRLTCLYASLKGIIIKREGDYKEDFSEIYLNLDAEEDEEIVTTEIDMIDKQSLIKLNDLLYGGMNFLSKNYYNYSEKIDRYRSRIQSYNYSIIQIKEAPIDIATEIFTRINVGGKSLSVFEIMVAKTFDPERNFDLAEKYDEFIKELENVSYDTISDATVLQTISMILKKECERKIILHLDKNKIIDIWEDTIDSIRKAIDYFRSYYRIPVSKLLPYNALIIPFAYFFYHHKDKPTGLKQKYLEDYFWRCSLSERFSSSVESKLAQDIKKIDLILKDEKSKYDWSIDTSIDSIIENGWFSVGRSYIKALLCILAYHQPKSFNDGSIVKFANDYLKQANSKNYHHFFPKSYLKKRGYEEGSYNHILNITIVDDFLNKREIGAKPPSNYMKKFSKINTI